jgi:cytochrome c556
MIRLRPLVAFAALCMAAAASAQMKPEVIIHYRQSVMSMIGWNFAPLAAMVKGKTAWDAKEFAKRAERLDMLAPQLLEGFAKGSDSGAETDAKAEIWQDFEDFQSKLDDFNVQAKALHEAAASGDETRMKDQFRKTASTCKACHDKFRSN